MICARLAQHSALFNRQCSMLQYEIGPPSVRKGLYLQLVK